MNLFHEVHDVSLAPQSDYFAELTEMDHHLITENLVHSVAHLLILTGQNSA